jgi:hypothetical protein
MFAFAAGAPVNRVSQKNCRFGKGASENAAGGKGFALSHAEIP